MSELKETVELVAELVAELGMPSDVSTPAGGDVSARLEGDELVIYEGRCTGDCCRSFSLPFTQEQFAKIKADPEKQKRYKDGERIFNMILPLGNVRTLPNGVREKDAKLAYYTCWHHDPISGNCTIYDTRPRMCRLYPYGNECFYVDCTLKQTRIRYR